jgi:carbonic anhydrase/acetyltransferase-like protein (isoleucine patch superfamily)
MRYSYQGVNPHIPQSVFIAPGAVVLGDVRIGPDSSIWFAAVLRGDVNSIRIGSRTNIQDASVLHVTHEQWDLNIGSDVTVGHAAILHGCTIGDCCLIGMGARVLDGTQIGDYCLVAAGSLVREGEKVPNYSLVAGVPAVVKRKLEPDEIEKIASSSQRYVAYKNDYMAGKYTLLPE